MPLPSDFALWDVIPELHAEDQAALPLLKDYLGKAGAPEWLLDDERFKSSDRLFEFYRHFCRAHVSLPVGNLGLATDPGSITHNYAMLLGKPLWQIYPKFPKLTEYWMHLFTGLVGSRQTIAKYANPDAFLNALQTSSTGRAGPSNSHRLLFRGQQRPTAHILSPMARSLLDPNTDGFRLQILGWDESLTSDFSQSHAVSRAPLYEDTVHGLRTPMDMGQILARFTLNLSMNTRVGMHSNWGGDEQESGLRFALATPFHLKLFRGGHTLEEAVQAGVHAGEHVISTTLNALPTGFVREYVAHLTDYELPVPLVGPGGIVRDFVPNPFVSTTTSLRTAMLYASGYFSKFDDKFTVNWADVYSRCSSPQNEGVVHVVATARSVLPITRIALADTIGAAEAEYGVPGFIAPEEIVESVPVTQLLERVDRPALEAYLDGCESGEPNALRQWDMVGKPKAGRRA
ncbi:MAG: hypothetical protein IT438_06755 [Phycisphaerales bacterium]|nr:hypothetical protein [Phycisphaerales bacterium]